MGETGLDLRDFSRALRRSCILIDASALLGKLVAGVASVMTQPTYTAEPQLSVTIQSSGSVQEVQQGNTVSQDRVRTDFMRADSPDFMRADSPAVRTPGREAEHKLASSLLSASDFAPTSEAIGAPI